jgi:hypothetical protein
MCTAIDLVRQKMLVALGRARCRHRSENLWGITLSGHATREAGSGGALPYPEHLPAPGPLLGPLTPADQRMQTRKEVGRGRLTYLARHFAQIRS